MRQVVLRRAEYHWLSIGRIRTFDINLAVCSIDLVLARALCELSRSRTGAMEAIRMAQQHDESPCPLCGARDYEASYAGLCKPCAASMVREHPERRLIVDGNSIRYVIPGEYPARRTPQPRDPDDITDPWEYAEHHGLPDPEDVMHWHGALERIHHDEPELFVDEVGHIFGPIELLPVCVVQPENSERNASDQSRTPW
jgi:hypothetical protein